MSHVHFFLSLAFGSNEETRAGELVRYLTRLPATTLTFGIPFLLLTSLYAYVLNALGYLSKRGCILAGSAFGLCLSSTLLLGMSEPLNDNILILASASLSGAICGWIYWRVAIGRPGQPA